MRVPGDVALIGYDDIDFARRRRADVLHAAAAGRRIGAAAIDLLLAEIDGNEVHRRIVFQPELVTRESTRPVRG